MAVKRDGQKHNEKKNLNLTLNSVALGIAVYGARASLYSQQIDIGREYKTLGGLP